MVRLPLVQFLGDSFIVLLPSTSTTSTERFKLLCLLELQLKQHGNENKAAAEVVSAEPEQFRYLLLRSLCNSNNTTGTLNSDDA